MDELSDEVRDQKSGKAEAAMRHNTIALNFGLLSSHNAWTTFRIKLPSSSRKEQNCGITCSISQIKSDHFQCSPAKLSSDQITLKDSLFNYL
jgi:hypothetical protein